MSLDGAREFLIAIGAEFLIKEVEQNIPLGGHYARGHFFKLETL
jgi:hypothetical protein